MSLLRLDAMPSHARRHPPNLHSFSPPFPTPSCVSPVRLVVDDCNGVAAIKWQPTFVGKQRGGYCSDVARVAGKGQRGEEKREVAGGGTQRSMLQLLQPQMAGRSRTYYAVDGDAG